MLEKLLTELSLINIILLDDNEQVIESHGPNTQELISANVVAMLKGGPPQPITAGKMIYQPLQITNRGLLAEEQLSGSYLILTRIKDRYVIATAENVDPGLLMFQLDSSLKRLISN
ncbi:MAG: hypothetical protein ACFFC7_17580 [Candidatus Hermodarchaeota archaeon]